MREAVEWANNAIENNDGPRMIVTPNSEIVIMAQEDRKLAEIINNADLKIPDGAGIVLASRILKDPVPERIAGFDLMKELLYISAQKGYSVYFLGGKPGIVDKAVKEIKKQVSPINICGSHHGYLDKDLQNKVISEVNSLEPDILFVGMGVPLQEKFIAANLKNLRVNIVMTVGGAFDVITGELKRAPLWMQRNHLEWLYRLLQEPRRFWRMLALPRFVFLVFRQYFRGGN